MNFQELYNSRKPYRRKFAMILQEVYATPGISRNELIISLALSKNNITETVNAMIAEGMIFERMDETGNGKVGRNPIGLYIRPDLFYTLGASLMREGPRIVLQDATRQVVDSRPLLHEGRMQQRFLGELRQKTMSLMQGVSRDLIVGIGVALPGIADFINGEVYYSQAFIEAGINLKSYFREHCGLESFLINASHIAAVMEKKYGNAAGMDNFVTIHDGLGVGMYLNGSLYRGWQFCCGEMGYTKITEDNILSQDGRSGLLLNHALPCLIGQQIIAKAKRGRKVKIEDKFLYDWSYIPVPQLVNAIERGDRLVAQSLGESFAYIGDAVVNLAYLLNPEAIFLPKWTERCPEYSLDIVRSKMRRYGFRNMPIFTRIISAAAEPSLMADTAGYMMGEECLKQLSETRIAIKKRKTVTAKSRKETAPCE